MWIVKNHWDCGQHLSVTRACELSIKEKVNWVLTFTSLLPNYRRYDHCLSCCYLPRGLLHDRLYPRAINLIKRSPVGCSPQGVLLQSQVTGQISNPETTHWVPACCWHGEGSWEEFLNLFLICKVLLHRQETDLLLQTLDLISWIPNNINISQTDLSKRVDLLI